jgi:hypothetical protein
MRLSGPGTFARTAGNFLKRLRACRPLGCAPAYTSR